MDARHSEFLESGIVCDEQLHPVSGSAAKLNGIGWFDGRIFAEHRIDVGRGFVEWDNRAGSTNHLPIILGECKILLSTRPYLNLGESHRRCDQFIASFNHALTKGSGGFKVLCVSFKEIDE